MDEKVLFDVINQLISERVNIFQLKEKLRNIVRNRTNENSDQVEISWRLVWGYLVRYGFIETDVNNRSVLTVEWDRLVNVGSIELYFDILTKEKEDIIQERKQGNKIQEETLFESKRNNRRSQWLSGASLFIAIITFTYSFVNKDSKEIDELKRRILHIEQENKILEEKIIKNNHDLMLFINTKL
ncbi:MULTISPECIES: hypothetical protein [Myroides]|uniref:hypothetical protein n=1 Tax=Myroides TaxID=76831 RepID=UPI0008F4C058|nr:MULTISPECIES: hypothetical protein [Myroides]APA92994.1 hypothetical protein BK054_12360 [Myroides sp. ZB35]MCS7475111.1 hypothetical protein [Myroides odoratimimus]MDM1034663.1 hypothetical protein [Myroides odoratimimus]MDM1038461.1 hypothetical protein [Myroides odoratimimus]MDM1053935.1 hypothetical protein [Myroides odoratimimus]